VCECLCLSVCAVRVARSKEQAQPKNKINQQHSISACRKVSPEEKMNQTPDNRWKG